MIQSTEHVFVMGHKSPTGVAQVRRLLQLAHPRSHLLMRSVEEPAWVEQVQARKCMAEEQPDLVYLLDLPSSEMTHPIGPAPSRPGGPTLPPNSVMAFSLSLKCRCIACV